MLASRYPATSFRALYADTIDGSTYAVVAVFSQDNRASLQLLQGRAKDISLLKLTATSSVGDESHVMVVSLIEEATSPRLLVIAGPTVGSLQYTTGTPGGDGGRRPSFTAVPLTNGIGQVALPRGSTDADVLVEAHGLDGALLEALHPVLVS